MATGIPSQAAKAEFRLELLIVLLQVQRAGVTGRHHHTFFYVVQGTKPRLPACQTGTLPCELTHTWAPGKTFLTCLFSTSLETFGLHPRRGTCVCPCLYEKHRESVSILTLSKIQESGQLAHFNFFV